MLPCKINTCHCAVPNNLFYLNRPTSLLSRHILRRLSQNRVFLPPPPLLLQTSFPSDYGRVNHLCKLGRSSFSWCAELFVRRFAFFTATMTGEISPCSATNSDVCHSAHCLLSPRPPPLPNTYAHARI